MLGEHGQDLERGPDQDNHDDDEHDDLPQAPTLKIHGDLLLSNGSDSPYTLIRAILDAATPGPWTMDQYFLVRNLAPELLAVAEAWAEFAPHVRTYAPFMHETRDRAYDALDALHAKMKEALTEEYDEKQWGGW